MNFSQLWDPTTTATDDVAQLKRDMKTHPRTSGRSLRELARVTYTQGSPRVHAQLDMAFDWLLENRKHLPSEIESDDGQRGSSSRLEVTGSDWQWEEAELDSLDTETGMYDVGTHDCYLPLTQIAKRNQSDLRLLNDYGMVGHVWHTLMRRRGALMAKRLDKEARRRLRRILPEVYGYRVAAEKGLKRTTIKSGAAATPEDIGELFMYADGVLRYRKSVGRKAAGSVVKDSVKQLTIRGTKYYRHRVIYRLVHGVDAGELNVSQDGLTATASRDATTGGTIWEVNKGNYQIDVKLGTSKRYTIAVCDSRAQAEAVQRGVFWYMNQ